jgi:hypothetical protein
MSGSQPVKAKPGIRSGDLVLELPPGWELRLRRVVKELMPEMLPDSREKGLTESQREARRLKRQELMRKAICKYIGDLIMADVVGKEVALSSRSRYGRRSGSLREHVAAILREAAGG